MNKNTNSQLVPERPLTNSYAVRAIGSNGLDVLCQTVVAIGPAQALGQVLAANLLSFGAEVARCWVITRL